MSYLVLARKWRPKRFAQLVGQEHVVRALSNALDTGRVHHAFLFTGTRGVGKTTIARIFAKSLNCETGTGAEPCGTCSACTEIDAGRFVDLLEIDAASHTGVDNIRELIDNAQYMPSRGRTKVYLIDEVHMLSKPAFNALLKTLEEPPEHVKFLLATTDPDKLPVTVLSRCLQFNLKRLDEAQIHGQMARILQAEDIAFEDGAIVQLAHAADGSLRDGLSLLDQAIAYTGGRLESALVGDMLGTVDRAQVGALLDALAAGDGEALMGTVETLSTFSPDYGAVLEALAAALHRIQLRQLVPQLAGGAGQGGSEHSEAAVAEAVDPTLVQLWYQMAVNGRRDLALAPSARVGFEMSLLRMLAFEPDADAGATPAAAGGGRPAAPSARPPATDGPAPRRKAPPNPLGQSGQARVAEVDAPGDPVHAPEPTAHEAPVRPQPLARPQPRPQAAACAPEPAPSQPPPSARDPAPPAADAAAPALATAADWVALVRRLGLRGPVAMLAEHAGFVGFHGGQLTLALSPSDGHLRSDRLVDQLAGAVAAVLGGPVQVRFGEQAPDAEHTVHAHNQREANTRRSEAEAGFLADPVVSRLVREHGASVVPDSIRPIEDQ